MICKIGDIIIEKGTIFKDNGLYDARISGHPVVILNANNENLHYLIVSSMKGKEIDPLQYCSMKPGSFNTGPRHECYVNCRDIYKRTVSESLYICNCVKEHRLTELLQMFIYYQEQVKSDEYYEEIVENVKRYKV